MAYDPNRMSPSKTYEAYNNYNSPNVGVYGNNGVGSDDENLYEKTMVDTDHKYVKADLARTQQVIQSRKNAGLDLTNQMAWLKRLQDADAMHTAKATEAEALKKKGVLDAIARKGSAYVEKQKALLAFARDQDIQALNKAYADADEQGKVAERRAVADNETRQQEINKQAYLDQEASNLVAHERGIQSSNQMLGMIASDNARKSELTNTNAKDRDRRISDIKDRLSAIATKRDLDIAGANSQYNYGVAGAQASADEMVAQQEGQFEMANYDREDQQAFQEGQTMLTDRLDTNKMGYKHGLDVDMMERNDVKQKENITLGADLQDRNDERSSARRLENDKVMEGIKHGNRLSELASDFGFKIRLQDNDAKNKADQLVKEREDKVATAEAMYQNALKHELNGLDPNSPEGKVKAAKVKEARDAMIDKIHAEVAYKGVQEGIFAQDTKTPEEPSNWIDDTGKWFSDAWTGDNVGDNIGNVLSKAGKGIVNWFYDPEGDEAKYQAKKKATEEAIARKKRFMENPSSFIYGEE